MASSYTRKQWLVEWLDDLMYESFKAAHCSMEADTPEVAWEKFLRTEKGAKLSADAGAFFWEVLPQYRMRSL